MPLPSSHRSPARQRALALVLLGVVVGVAAFAGVVRKDRVAAGGDGSGGAHEGASSSGAAGSPADSAAASPDDPAGATAAEVAGAAVAASPDGATVFTVGATSPTTAASLPPLNRDPIARQALPTVPAGGLFPGGRPPQFVLVSFDGAVDPALLARWEQVAGRSQAHLSFFLSAVYLLARDVSKTYQAPGHRAGASAIGFVPNNTALNDRDFLRDAVTGLHQTVQRGNELGNHYGGHWCGAKGVGVWNAADWAGELNAVEDLVGNVDANNSLSPPVGAPYDPLHVAGSRTPCLEGDLDALYPVLAARGYRYDASNTRRLEDWPTRRKGLWAYGFPAVDIPGQPKKMLTVDFTLSTVYGGSALDKELPVARAQQISNDVLAGYRAAFDSIYYGNRAPFEVSNHFAHSDHDAYNRAVEQFMVDECTRPEVQCVTYSEMTDWLDAHRGQLAAFQEGRFTKASR